MTTWEAILLGFIQGITEFLPVSSSGHLELAQYFLGLENLDQYVLFDLVCHLGTLLAVFCLFFTTIKQMIYNDRSKLLQIVLATLPLFPLVLVIKPLKALFDQPQYLGFCFCLTALLLFLGPRVSLSLERVARRNWSDPLVIGTFQAIAILPGVSRSGSTISAARMLGWNMRDAVTFSMLMAIPAILGGTILEVVHVWRDPSATAIISPFPYILGFIISFATGLVALIALFRLAMSNKLGYFAWYCLLLGISCVIYFNLL